MKGRKKVQELPIKELAILSRESADPRTRRIEDRRTDDGLSESQGKCRLIEVIERKGVEETAIRLAQENAVMAEIGRIISSTLNIEEVYERFAAEARKLIPFDRIAVSLNNPGEGTATITYVSGVEFEGKRIGDVFPLARSGSEEVNRTRRGFLVQPEAIEELEGRFSGLIPTFQAGLRSMIVVPLISRNQVIGVLHLRSKESKAYTDRDLRLAERIANQIAGAIANAQFFLERRRAEEALRKSEERFRDLYDSAPVGYHEYDTEGRITNVNRTDLEMLGYSQEEMIGQYIWKFNVGEDIVRQQVLEKLQGLRPPGRSLERTYRRKDGTTFPVLIEDRLNKDELGRITGIRSTIQDITEPKGMEAALRESEAEAKRLAAETGVLAKIGRLISSTLNTDEVYELFAEEVRKVLPFDRMAVNIVDRERNTATIAYVTGMPVRDRAAKESFPLAGSLTAEGIRTREGIIFHPQNEDEVAGRFPRLLSTFRSGLRSMIMVPLISKDRTIGVLHFAAMQPNAYTQDDLRLGLRVGNQIAGAMANSLLFTEFQKADSALRESEEKYRLLVQNANDAIFIIQDGAIRFSNVRTEALFGYSPGELAAIPFVNHIHPGERERILGPGSQVSAVETFSRPQSFRIINKSNQEVWVQLKSIGVEWEGKPATLNFASDITEQKKLEAQFLQAQKMEAIGTLAGGIAHDFNNILSGLLGYAELISLETRPGSSIHRNLEELLKVGVRAKDLVKQILTLSRRTLQEKKPIRVEPLVKEAVKLLRSSLPTTIEIRLDIKEDPGIIEADPTQVHQVLLNLCTNSFHAMEETGGLLTIGLSPINLDPYAAGQHADLQQGPYVRLTVSDTGMGMAREMLDRIFDPYFTTKEAGKGTGLGLAVVHGIVQSHGGAIKVYSEPGKGTTFHIYFPRVEISAEGPSLGLTEESLPRGKGEHIFLIDDEPVLLEIGKQMLEHLGYQVTVRTSSIEALGLFSSQPSRFHLVITDMTMPNMTGEKLAREILRIRPGLPIILCTGFSEHVTEEKAKALGIREFLMKPLTLKYLARAVRRNLPPSVD